MQNHVLVHIQRIKKADSDLPEQTWCVCGFICGIFLCPYLLLISPSFDALGGLCFVIVVFPGYLYLYFYSLIGAFLSH